MILQDVKNIKIYVSPTLVKFLWASYQGFFRIALMVADEWMHKAIQPMKDVGIPTLKPEKHSCGLAKVGKQTD